jgi:hypothetical protein
MKLQNPTWVTRLVNEKKKAPLVTVFHHEGALSHSMLIAQVENECVE